jgi:hypothetical protein
MFYYIILFLIIALFACVLFNEHLPKWFCDHLGWHLAPKHYQDFDGVNFKGICPRCNKEVLQDSQGPWL